jgi:hypothetical protein
MRDAGFEVIERQAHVLQPTNAIWAGDQVPLQDVKLVGLALLRAGVNVVTVRRFHDGTGHKARLIQVGAIALLAGEPGLSPRDIESLGTLPRDPGPVPGL